MKVSVIIPVFNVEKYLSQCIDSVLNQSYSDLEIILVNDGSTDGSKAICDEYVLRDKRVQVIHQPNAGVSVARNTGINVATGDYITFVDSDDWIDVETYQYFIESAKKNNFPDVLMCDFINSSEVQTTPISSHLPSDYYNKERIINKIYPSLLVTEDFGRIPIVSACICWFRKSLFIDQAIRFDETLHFSEDYLFMAEVMTRAQTFFYLKDQYFYHYRQYKTSRSKKYQKQWWPTLLELNKKLRIVLENSEEFDFERQLNLQLIHSALLVSNAIMVSSNLRYTQKMKLLYNLLHTKELNTSFYTIELRSNSKFQQLILYMLKYKMTVSFIVYNNVVSLIKRYILNR